MFRAVFIGLLLVLSQLNTLAQTQQDLAFEETRKRIWCETFRFIYKDNGGDSLLTTLDCTSWDAMLEHTKEHDIKYGAYRFYTSVDKPAIYQGIVVEEQKLNKLAGEIQYKLLDKRKGNKRKEASVDSLYKVLQRIAYMMVGSTNAEVSAGKLQQTSGDGIGPDSANQPDDEVILDQQANLSETDSGINWSEWLQWLFILLSFGGIYYLYTQNALLRKKLRGIRNQTQEIQNFYTNSSKPEPEVASQPTSITEDRVKELIEEEVRKHQPVPASSKPENKPEPYEDENVETKIHTRDPATLINPEKIANSTESQPVSENKPKNPVQQPAANKPVFLYDKMPVRGGFHQGGLSKTPQRDSVYIIQPKPDNPQEAHYWINEEPEVQKYAMQNGLSFFEEGCTVDVVLENPTRVINVKKGLLKKEAPSWQIVEKARIKFE